MDPVLKLDNDPIQIVKEATFVGLTWDSKLTFEPHIKYLKAWYQKSLNIPKVLSRTEWGADRTTLLKLYRSLVRSKLDYSCIVYGSASKTALAKLDPVHSQGLHLSLGAFRSSPVDSETEYLKLNPGRENLRNQNNMAVVEAVFDIKHTYYSELLVNFMFNHSRNYKNTKYKHR